MYIKSNGRQKRPVLHIVDVATRFSAAFFLQSVDAASIWNALLRAWSTIYVGFPESMLTDPSSCLHNGNMPVKPQVSICATQVQRVTTH